MNRRDFLKAAAATAATAGVASAGALAPLDRIITTNTPGCEFVIVEGENGYPLGLCQTVYVDRGYVERINLTKTLDAGEFVVEALPFRDLWIGAAAPEYVDALFPYLKRSDKTYELPDAAKTITESIEKRVMEGTQAEEDRRFIEQLELSLDWDSLNDVRALSELVEV